ncbi:serine/threonine protein kinase [Aerolutibacter ruishenii]|uniref:Serine/threonine protein kinase n=1 Tax=Aerolutibacter ruishenii TaxID=686800 RepID=A0A562LKW7_9GAMM|nr:bifunctional serine/threonine-protein kinase/universal stress protein [Lysobacter ruishenii]TWI08226.1 serine/threonine protein kinase [Lysobacter ruishenii]
MPVRVQPGMQIGGFELLGPLHEGGMATLWRVRHPDHADELLMKLPRIGYGEAATHIVGFEVERMILPALSGPHVPRFIASGDFEDQPWLVMEHLHGDTLRPLLEHAPLPPAQVAELGIAAATAIHAVHQQHVVHLDIKPSNLLRRADGSIALIDFGLSHHAHLPDLLAEQFNIPIGTAPYIAPEQVLGVRNDPRSDLFALGVTLYHLATGERPFGNPTSPAGLRRRLYQDPVPPRALQKDLPRWLQEIILHCLEVDPDHRYATAAQVAHALQHRDQVPLTERAERAQRAGRWTRLQRWWRSKGYEHDPRGRPGQQLDEAPLLMVAVDLKHDDPRLTDALQLALQRVLSTFPQARLACVTVMRTPRIGLDSNIDAEGRNRHVKRLLALRHWARPLKLGDRPLTVHVLEHSDPAEALIEFARNNRVDHLVMGARGITGVRRLLGSVSARVVAEATCTVTVVRAPQPDDGAPA